MSTARINVDLMAPPVVNTIGRRSLVIGLIFSVIAIVLAFVQPQEFFRGYLLSFMAWLGITLGSMAILMIRHMTGGTWGTVIRRVMGAAMRCVPLMTVLFIPIFFGMSKLYVWDRPFNAIPDEVRKHLQASTRSFLTVQGFILRAIIYFAIWNLLSFFLTKWSKRQNRPPIRDYSTRFKALSGPGLILYAFTTGFASIDWIMSIDPGWISTIYGLIILAGQLLTATCFAVVIERILVNHKPMDELLKADYVHDHGKWMLTFIMLWAYFSFSQLLIIWSGDLPDEISWYLKRYVGGWGWVGICLALFHFAVPFAVLLSRPLKRNIRKLVWVAVWLMVMRYVDLFWFIEPNFSVKFTVTWADVILPIGMGGLWLAYFCRNLSSLPLLPAYDTEAQQVLEA